MSELGIEMTKAELAEPVRHKERVRKVFLQLVRSAMDVLHTLVSLFLSFSHTLHSWISVAVSLRMTFSLLQPCWMQLRPVLSRSFTRIFLT
jgi:hypothetical protein